MRVHTRIACGDIEIVMGKQPRQLTCIEEIRESECLLLLHPNFETSYSQQVQLPYPKASTGSNGSIG